MVIKFMKFVKQKYEYEENVEKEKRTGSKI